jgi:hypothetical protein
VFSETRLPVLEILGNAEGTERAGAVRPRHFLCCKALSALASFTRLLYYSVASATSAAVAVVEVTFCTFAQLTYSSSFTVVPSSIESITHVSVPLPPSR